MVSTQHSALSSQPSVNSGQRSDAVIEFVELFSFLSSGNKLNADC